MLGPQHYVRGETPTCKNMNRQHYAAHRDATSRMRSGRKCNGNDATSRSYCNTTSRMRFTRKAKRTVSTTLCIATLRHVCLKTQVQQHKKAGNRLAHTPWCCSHPAGWACSDQLRDLTRIHGRTNTHAQTTSPPPPTNNNKQQQQQQQQQQQTNNKQKNKTKKNNQPTTTTTTTTTTIIIGTKA